MTTRTQTCAIVACDCCGKDVEFGVYIPHFDTAKEARSVLEASYGWTDGAVDICAGCKYHDHAFVPNLPFDDCGRCGIEAAEHEEASGDQCPAWPKRGPRLPHTCGPDGIGDTCAACGVEDDARHVRLEDR